MAQSKSNQINNVEYFQDEDCQVPGQGTAREGLKEGLPILLDQVLGQAQSKEQLRLILKVKDAASFQEFFHQLRSTTERDIALALIHQATVVQIMCFGCLIKVKSENVY